MLQQIKTKNIKKIVYIISLFLITFQIILLSILHQNWPVTLNLLVPDSSIPYQEFIQAFESQHPRIHIKLVVASGQSNNIATTDDLEASYRNVFRTSNGSPFDLIYLDVILVEEFAQKGWLQDIDSLSSPQQLKQFQKNFRPLDWQGGIYENKQYRIPFFSAVGMLFYREDLLGEKKVPQTFNELITIAKELQNPQEGLWGYVWQGKQYEGLVAMFMEVLKGYGGFWLNPETKEVGLNQQAALKAAQFLRQLKQISPPDITTYDENKSLQTFLKGKAIFLRNWPYALREIDASIYKGKVKVMPLISQTGQNRAGCLGGWGFAIAKNSKHQKEAWQAIQFFVEEINQKKLFTETGFLPSYQNLNVGRLAQDSLNALEEIFSTAVLRPQIPDYKKASKILQNYLYQVLTSKEDITKIMNNAAQETRDLIEYYQ